MKVYLPLDDTEVNLKCYRVAPLDKCRTSPRDLFLAFNVALVTIVAGCASLEIIDI